MMEALGRFPIQNGDVIIYPCDSVHHPVLQFFKIVITK